MGKDGDQSKELLIRTYQSEYTSEFLQQENVNNPDIVVFFNPGFTCPDYTTWTRSLRVIANDTPFLSTTNTELEGIADCQYLLDNDMILSVPPGLAAALDVED